MITFVIFFIEYFFAQHTDQNRQKLWQANNPFVKQKGQFDYIHPKYKTTLDSIDKEHIQAFKYDEKGFKNLSYVEDYRKKRDQFYKDKLAKYDEIQRQKSYKTGSKLAKERLKNRLKDSQNKLKDQKNKQHVKGGNNKTHDKQSSNSKAHGKQNSNNKAHSKQNSNNKAHGKQSSNINGQNQQAGGFGLMGFGFGSSGNSKGFKYANQKEKELDLQFQQKFQNLPAVQQPKFNKELLLEHYTKDMAKISNVVIMEPEPYQDFPFLDKPSFDENDGVLEGQPVYDYEYPSKQWVPGVDPELITLDSQYEGLGLPGLGIIVPPLYAPGSPDIPPEFDSFDDKRIYVETLGQLLTDEQQLYMKYLQMVWYEFESYIDVLDFQTKQIAMNFKDAPDKVYMKISTYKKKMKPNPKMKNYKKKLKDYEFNRNKVFGMVEEMKMMRLLNYKPFCREFFDPSLNLPRSSKLYSEVDFPSDVTKGLRYFELDDIKSMSENTQKFFKIFDCYEQNLKISQLYNSDDIEMIGDILQVGSPYFISLNLGEFFFCLVRDYQVPPFLLQIPEKAQYIFKLNPFYHERIPKIPAIKKLSLFEIANLNKIMSERKKKFKDGRTDYVADLLKYYGKKSSKKIKKLKELEKEIAKMEKDGQNVAKQKAELSQLKESTKEIFQNRTKHEKFFVTNLKFFIESSPEQDDWQINMFNKVVTLYDFGNEKARKQITALIIEATTDIVKKGLKISPALQKKIKLQSLKKLHQQHKIQFIEKVLQDYEKWYIQNKKLFKTSKKQNTHKSSSSKSSSFFVGGINFNGSNQSQNKRQQHHKNQSSSQQQQQQKSQEKNQSNKSFSTVNQNLDTNLQPTKIPNKSNMINTTKTITATHQTVRQQQNKKIAKLPQNTSTDIKKLHKKNVQKQRQKINAQKKMKKNYSKKNKKSSRKKKLQKSVKKRRKKSKNKKQKKKLKKLKKQLDKAKYKSYLKKQNKKKRRLLIEKQAFRQMFKYMVKDYKKIWLNKKRKAIKEKAHQKMIRIAKERQTKKKLMREFAIEVFKESIHNKGIQKAIKKNKQRKRKLQEKKDYYKFFYYLVKNYAAQQKQLRQLKNMIFEKVFNTYMNPSKKIFNFRKLKKSPMQEYAERKKSGLAKNQVHYIKEIRDPLPGNNVDDDGKPLDDEKIGDVLISFDQNHSLENYSHPFNIEHFMQRVKNLKEIEKYAKTFKQNVKKKKRDFVRLEDEIKQIEKKIQRQKKQDQKNSSKNNKGNSTASVVGAASFTTTQLQNDKKILEEYKKTFKSKKTEKELIKEIQQLKKKEDEIFLNLAKNHQKMEKKQKENLKQLLAETLVMREVAASEIKHKNTKKTDKETITDNLDVLLQSLKTLDELNKQVIDALFEDNNKSTNLKLKQFIIDIAMDKKQIREHIIDNEQYLKEIQANQTKYKQFVGANTKLDLESLGPYYQYKQKTLNNKNMAVLLQEKKKNGQKLSNMEAIVFNQQKSQNPEFALDTLKKQRDEELKKLKLLIAQEQIVDDLAIIKNFDFLNKKHVLKKPNVPVTASSIIEEAIFTVAQKQDSLLDRYFPGENDTSLDDSIREAEELLKLSLKEEKKKTGKKSKRDKMHLSDQIVLERDPISKQDLLDLLTTQQKKKSDIRGMGLPGSLYQCTEFQQVKGTFKAWESSFTTAERKALEGMGYARLDIGSYQIPQYLKSYLYTNGTHNTIYSFRRYYEPIDTMMQNDDKLEPIKAYFPPILQDFLFPPLLVEQHAHIVKLTKSFVSVSKNVMLYHSMNLLVVKLDVDSLGYIERLIDPTALIIRDISGMVNMNRPDRLRIINNYCAPEVREHTYQNFMGAEFPKPELITLTERADVWAFGLTILRMIWADQFVDSNVYLSGKCRKQKCYTMLERDVFPELVGVIEQWKSTQQKRAHRFGIMEILKMIKEQIEEFRKSVKEQAVMIKKMAEESKALAQKKAEMAYKESQDQAKMASMTPEQKQEYMAMRKKEDDEKLQKDEEEKQKKEMEEERKEQEEEKKKRKELGLDSEDDDDEKEGDEDEKNSTKKLSSLKKPKKNEFIRMKFLYNKYTLTSDQVGTILATLPDFRKIRAGSVRKSYQFVEYMAALGIYLQYEVHQFAVKMVAPEIDDRPTMEEVDTFFKTLMLEYLSDPFKVVAKGLLDANEEKYQQVIKPKEEKKKKKMALKKKKIEEKMKKETEKHLRKLISDDAYKNMQKVYRKFLQNYKNSPKNNTQKCHGIQCQKKKKFIHKKMLQIQREMTKQNENDFLRKFIQKLVQNGLFEEEMPTINRSQRKSILEFLQIQTINV